MTLNASREIEGSVEAEPTPEDLIRRIAEGHQPSFVTFFTLFAPKVKGYLFKLNTPPELADELTQEVMLKVWRRAGGFDERKGSASGWLFTIVRNIRIDAVRRERHPDELVGEDIADGIATPEQFCLARERRQRLQAAMAELTPAQAAVFSCSLLREGTLSDVAERLGMTLATTKSHLHRALLRLRRTMETGE